jgi:predicted DNA-binding transcriptional regulator AlpA
MFEPDRLYTNDDLDKKGVGSRPTRWRWVRQAAFPPPIQISKNKVAWRGSDLLIWWESRQPVAWAACKSESSATMVT